MPWFVYRNGADLVVTLHLAGESMPRWNEHWEAALFERAVVHPSTGPKLGVNYVQASAPSTTVELQTAPSSLVVGQDLAKHGIAGVVWNCVRVIALDRVRSGWCCRCPL